MAEKKAAEKPKAEESKDEQSKPSGLADLLGKDIDERMAALEADLKKMGAR